MQQTNRNNNTNKEQQKQLNPTRTQSHPVAPNRPEKEKERYSYYFEVVEEIKFDRGIKLGLGTEIDFCDVQKNGSFEHFFYTIEHFSVPVLFTVVFFSFFQVGCKYFPLC